MLFVTIWIYCVPTPKKIQIARTCVMCHKDFVPKRCCAKLCSKLCRIKYANQIRKEQKKLWALQNRQRLNKLQKDWIKQNPDKRRKSSAKYVKKNLEYYTQYRSLHNRHLLQAKPKWADELKLKQIYREAKERGLEVDHIIPLKHTLVSGLHVPENLQLLTRSENAQKSNKFDILVGYKDE